MKIKYFKPLHMLIFLKLSTLMFKKLTYIFFFKLQVTIGPDGSCAQNGMVAIADVQEGESLFRISRKILLHPKSSSISALFEKGTIIIRMAFFFIEKNLIFFINEAKFWTKQKV